MKGINKKIKSNINIKRNKRRIHQSYFWLFVFCQLSFNILWLFIRHQFVSTDRPLVFLFWDDFCVLFFYHEKFIDKLVCFLVSFRKIQSIPCNPKQRTKKWSKISSICPTREIQLACKHFLMLQKQTKPIRRRKRNWKQHRSNQNRFKNHIEMRSDAIFVFLLIFAIHKTDRFGLYFG